MTVCAPMRTCGKRPATAGGWTLVELMVVLVVVALLTAIGVPSYRSYTQNARRAAATAALEEAAARQEQFFLSDKTYTTTVGGAGLNMSATTDGGHYALSVDAPDADCAAARCYVLRATPQGGQAGDSCGALTLSSGGDKLPQGCW